MKFNDVVRFVLDSPDYRTPLCLLGPPGTGKTSIGPAVAEAMTIRRREKDPLAPAAVCTVLDLSSRLPEDIGGLPFIVNGVTKYAAQSWLARLCEPGTYGVLVLDDLPASTPAVQVAVRQLVLDRQIGDWKLADGVAILVTGNRREDKSAASVLPAHFRNSVCLVNVDVDREGWCHWYARQEGHAPVVSSFLQYKDHLSKLPKDADERGAFATPRTWAKLGRLFDHANKSGMLLDVAAGLVGEGVAIEFVAFVNVRANLVDPADILRDPEKAIPNPRQYLDTPDKVYAAMTGIAETAAAWVLKGGKEAKTAERQFLLAMAHLADGHQEYAPVAINTYSANLKMHVAAKAARKLIQSLTQTFMNDLSNNEKVRALVEYTVKVMDGGSNGR